MAWSGDDLPRTPFISQVFDSSQVSVYGPGLSSNIAKIQKPIEFTIQAKLAGPGTPEVRAVGAVNTYAGDIQNNKDGTFQASVTPWELGDVTLEILWGGVPIPTSPYEMKVIRAIETGTYSAKGEFSTSFLRRVFELSTIASADRNVSFNVLSEQVTASGRASSVRRPAS